MNKKMKLLVLSVIVVVVAAGVGVFLYVRNHNSKSAETEKQQYAQIVANTQSLVSARKYTQAENQWLAYIKGDHDKKYIRGAYVQLATTYSNAQKYDDAVSYYKKAEALDGNSAKLDVVTGLAYTYETQGNKSEAIKYFNKAITLTQDSNDPSKNADIQGYKYEISQLEGQQ